MIRSIVGRVRSTLFIAAFLAAASASATAQALKSKSDVRDNFYRIIIPSIATGKITSGGPDIVGKSFDVVYQQGAKPKALAVCVNWEDSTPKKPSFGAWNFITGGPAGCSESEKAVALCVLQACLRLGWCKERQQCALLDINNVNALEIPDRFATRWKLE